MEGCQFRATFESSLVQQHDRHGNAELIVMLKLTGLLGAGEIHWMTRPARIAGQPLTQVLCNIQLYRNRVFQCTGNKYPMSTITFTKRSFGGIELKTRSPVPSV